MGKQLELFEDEKLSPKYWNVPFVDEVQEFNEMMGKPNNYEPVIGDKKSWKFVYDFIMEELEEYKEACEKGHVIGLSKLNRIVEHFGRRGAIQEQLTADIHQTTDKVCENNLGVIITVVATHNCVSCRGVKHKGAAMVTTKASGVFRHNGNDARQEFFNSLKINNGGHQI